MKNAQERVLLRVFIISCVIFNVIYKQKIHIKSLIICPEYYIIIYRRKPKTEAGK